MFKRKRSKYNNRKVEQDGMKFDSLKELHVWNVLCARQADGEISNLERQVSYRFEVCGNLIRYLPSKRPLTYIADYRYVEDGKYVVDDAKGLLTQEYKIKKALMFWVNGIEIKE